MKYTIVKNNKALDKMIEDCIVHTKTVKDNIQNVLINILVHLARHGNKNVIEKCNHLIKGMGTGVRSDHIVKYMQEFGGLKIAKDKSGFDVEQWSGAAYIEARLEVAKNTMWYDFQKTANPFNGFDMDAEIIKLVKRQQKVMKDSADMSDEDKAKIHMVVRQDTIRQLLDLCGISGMKPEQPAKHEERDISASVELVRHTGTTH